jgi:hypothetical protein
VSAAIRKWLGIIALCSAPAWVTAHHSVAEFDLDKPLTIEATVKEVWFSNPHVRYYVTVKAPDGTEETWDVHGSSVTSLARRGWTKSTIKVGDKIRINGSPNREGAKRILIRSIVLPNGSTLSSAGSQNDAENAGKGAQ